MKLTNFYKGKEHTESLNNFAWVVKGQIISTEGPCYAELRILKRPEELRILVKQVEGLCDVQDEFWQWVTKESSFRTTFTNTKFKNWKEVGLRCNLNLSRSHVIGGAILMRFAWEEPDALKLWKEFKDAGLSPAMAFLMANFWRKSLNLYSFGSVLGGHGLFSQLDDRFARPFLKNEIPAKQTAWGRDESIGWTIFNLFDNSVTDMYENPVCSFPVRYINKGWNRASVSETFETIVRKAKKYELEMLK